jgi:hypothetical protein
MRFSISVPPVKWSCIDQAEGSPQGAGLNISELRTSPGEFGTVRGGGSSARVRKIPTGHCRLDAMSARQKLMRRNINIFLYA